MSAERWLSALLKFNATVLMLAFVAVFLPQDWMASINDRLGLEKFPRTALVGYLTRSASGLYGILGIGTWIIARDLRRYWPLVTLWGTACIACGPLILILDLSVGMPILWTAFEGAYLFAMGSILLLLQRRAGKTIARRDAER